MYTLDGKVMLAAAAVDANAFQPDLTRPRRGANGRVTVVALSRLVYRKGVDLLNVVIPAVCRRQPHVDFIIGALSAFACWQAQTASVNITLSAFWLSVCSPNGADGHDMDCFRLVCRCIQLIA